MKPTNYTTAQLSQHVSSYYATWKQKYLRTWQNGVYILYDSGTEVTVSEAHGYLMLVSVMMNDKDTFDKAVNYFLKFRDNNNLMEWQQSKDGSGNIFTAGDGGDSATDGDMDIILGLYLAHCRWTSGTGVNYLQLAQTSIQGFVRTCINPTLNSLKLGDWSSSNTDQFGLCTRPSDFMVMHLKVFALLDTPNTALWNRVHATIMNVCSTIFSKNSPNTGFLPDFAVYKSGAWAPTPGQILEAGTDKDYSWNSCRIFMRLATEFFDPNSTQTGLRSMIQKSNDFIKASCGQDPNRIYSGYSLAGNALNQDTDLAYQAPFMLSAVVSNDQAWLNKLYDYVIKQQNGSYYGDSIKMLCLLMVTGNYLTVTSS